MGHSEPSFHSKALAAAATRADVVLDALRRCPGAYLLGIAGIPGSGKTTLCEVLRQARPDCQVVPMDGYHLPRSLLDAEGLRRRGAPFTFDSLAFRRDIQRLKHDRAGLFPTFDHAEKDPRPDRIRIDPATPLVIVEGIYVLMHDWQLEPLFDLRIFVDCDLDEATERLTRRHVETGISQTLAEARDRAVSNDRVNAMEILADGCRERADLVLPG